MVYKPREFSPVNGGKKDKIQKDLQPTYRTTQIRQKKRLRKTDSADLGAGCGNHLQKVPQELLGSVVFPANEQREQTSLRNHYLFYAWVS